MYLYSLANVNQATNVIKKVQMQNNDYNFEHLSLCFGAILKLPVIHQIVLVHCKVNDDNSGTLCTPLRMISSNGIVPDSGYIIRCYPTATG